MTLCCINPDDCHNYTLKFQPPSSSSCSCLTIQNEAAVKNIDIKFSILALFGIVFMGAMWYGPTSLLFNKKGKQYHYNFTTYSDT